MATTETKAMLRSGAILMGFCTGLGLGCLSVRPDPDHCANLDGNRTCEDRYPGERTFCTACGATPDEDGCVARRPEEDACYSPCGGQTRIEDDATCLVDTSSSSGEESTSTGEPTGTESSDSSGESSTTGPMPCVGNEDCPDAAAPFCEPITGDCVACDALGAEADAACADLDPMAPLCVSGTCVACTPENPVVCDDQLLLCDGGTNSCVPCTEHEECGSGACELAMGRCFPEDFVVHVDGDGGQDYMTIAAAVAAVDDGTHGVIVVHELDMAAPYATSVTIDGGKTIALLAAPGEAPNILGTGGNPGLQVTSAGTVLYVDGLSVTGNTMGLGLRVDGALAWVDRSRVVGNSGGGIVAQNAAELTLRNCFVGGGTDVIGVEVVDASASVLYSTISASTFNTTPALSCTTPIAVDVRNSIIVSQGGTSPDELSCGAATITSSATEADVGPFNAGWFVNFNGGDYHLTASGTAAFADVANWSTGDPSTDIDGDARPTIDGTADYAGADVPQ